MPNRNYPFAARFLNNRVVDKRRIRCGLPSVRLSNPILGSDLPIKIPAVLPIRRAEGIASASHGPEWAGHNRLDDAPRFAGRRPTKARVPSSQGPCCADLPAMFRHTSRELTFCFLRHPLNAPLIQRPNAKAVISLMFFIFQSLVQHEIHTLLGAVRLGILTSPK